VTFRHPNAPDEKRAVSVMAGQTVLLDVAMRIERPPVDAGPPPADTSASP
jgi:serine/threonine-protein kinase